MPNTRLLSTTTTIRPFWMLVGIFALVLGAKLLVQGLRETRDLASGPLPVPGQTLVAITSQGDLGRRYVRVSGGAGWRIGRQFIRRGLYQTTHSFDILIVEDHALLVWTDDNAPDTATIRVGTLMGIPDTYDRELLAPLRIRYPRAADKILPFMLSAQGDEHWGIGLHLAEALVLGLFGLAMVRNTRHP